MPFRHMRWYHLVALWAVAIPFIAFEAIREIFCGEQPEPLRELWLDFEPYLVDGDLGALSIDGKKFDYKTNERLHKALELKLFEDQKDTIKLTSLVSNVVDRATQEKIDVVKSRLIKYFGYDEISATDVLNFVASIFARGDVKKRD